MAENDSLQEFLTIAVDAAKKAGEIIRKEFYEIKHVEHKGQVDLVTETDKACEDLIFNHLRQHYPKHKLIGEETTAACGTTELTDEPTWIVDPLDGTTNFVHGFPFVCVSIGLTIGKIPKVGVVYNPIMDELFTGIHGKGAFLNGKPIKVSSQSELVKSLLATEVGIHPSAAEEFMQALYFCVPFREQLLEYYANNKNLVDTEENLLTCLADLFTQKKKTSVISPKRFVQRLKKQNEIFRGYMHQDAHEFLNYLLNELVDILEKESQAATSDHETTLPPEKIANGPKTALANGAQKEPLVTWVHKNFHGILTNETRCLRCETVTARDETFFDLSLDIEQNSSITSCLKNFSSTETLNAEDKFFCDKCCSLQEAQKRMKIKKPPQILVIHLKRFKYIEQLGR